VADAITDAPKTRQRSLSESRDQAVEEERKRPRLGLILAAVVMLTSGTSIGVIFIFGLPWYVPVLQPWAVIAGIALFLAGLVVLRNAFQALGVARAFGRELHASKRSRLITVGLYGYSRHPIYLGALLLLFGWFFVTRLTALLILTLLSVILFYFVAKWEERELTARFGAQYVEYKRAVPFFIPHPKLRKRQAENTIKRRRQPTLPERPRDTTQ
jgi:protein-S-isoprenylcysteine O-methyltransferase Ste14